MAEIQRYSCSPAVLHPESEGYLVRWQDALAHETAALEAQAEEHLRRRKIDDADWGDRFMALSREHAQELAEARGVGEPASPDDARVLQTCQCCYCHSNRQK